MYPYTKFFYKGFTEAVFQAYPPTKFAFEKERVHKIKEINKFNATFSLGQDGKIA